VLDNVNIFRMNLDQTAVFFGFFQQLDHDGIIHPEVIDHKNLKAWRAVVPACVFNLIDHIRSGIHDCRVQRIIHTDFALRQGFFALQGLEEGFSFLLQIKIHHTGDTATGRCDGAGLIVILGIGPHKGHGNMGVGINRPGKNVLTPGIDDFIGRIVQIGADGLDFVAIGKYIGQITAGRVNNGSTFK